MAVPYNNLFNLTSQWSAAPSANLVGNSSQGQAYGSNLPGQPYPSNAYGPQVLGASTGSTATTPTQPTPKSLGGAPSNPAPGTSPYQVGQVSGNYRWNGTGWEPLGQSGQAPSDPYAGVRNDISSSWDSYLSSLNDTGTYLNDQQNAQTGIADTQLNQGITTANDQKAKSLKDIANTTRNAFQAGNNYLGSLGAGDSSAANQYSFAINQQAGKQTGDLNNFVQGQIQNLQNQHDTQVQQIAQWFAGQQEALKQQIAQGGLQKGQDLANLSKGILDQAMQATNALKANTQNQYNSLVTWAANNSQNLGQLQSNIAGIPQAMGQLQTMGGGQTPIQFGGTGGSGKTDLFGNPIQ